MRAVPPVRDHYSITTCEPLPQFSFVSYSLRILTGEKVDLELSSDDGNIFLIMGIPSRQ